MEKNVKHGIPTSFRIPPELKEKLTAQATQKGISLSQHLENLLLEPLENTSKQQAAKERLEAENKQLKDYIKKLKEDLSVMNEERKNVIQILLKNETILKEAFEQFKSEKFDRNILVNKGFNFSFATHKALEFDYFYTGVFGYSYVNFHGNKIKVIKGRTYAAS